MNQNIKYLFLSAPVPETSKFMLPGVCVSGNMAVTGIADGLYAATGGEVDVCGFWGIRGWPHVKKMFVRKQKVDFPSGLQVTLLPDINIIGLREISRFVVSLACVVGWALKNVGRQKIIVTYNYTIPSLVAVLMASRVVHVRVVPILFDVGNPLTMKRSVWSLIRAIPEKLSRAAVAFSSGAGVITKQVQVRFMPRKSAFLIDGGVSPQIIERLFELKRALKDQTRKEVVFLLAGSLFPYNGVDLALRAMRIVRVPNIRLIIAGHGSAECEQAIFDAAKSDKRITFVGQKTLDGLFEIYKSIDVFLNLRITKEIDTSCFFPSKFLEALAVGRYVISTNVAHLREEYEGYCKVLEDECPDALARAITDVANMSRAERDALGARAQQMMLNTHTWRHQMARFHEYCKRLVKGLYSECSGMVKIDGN